MRNLILVFAFFIVSACNSSQKSTAVFGTAEKVETVITIRGKNYNCDQIIVNGRQPINECGIKDGRITVREICAYSTAAKDSSFIDRKGILQVKGDLSFKSAIK